ncbi:MAG: hypothetical protein WC812_01080 [Candidatus Pacearchaeota archaeon]|jgi:hypothetical protein
MKEVYKRQLNQLKWIAVWTIIYAILFWVSNLFLTKVFSSMNFFIDYRVFYFLFMGILLAFLSKTIHSSIKKKRLRIDLKILFWIILFMALIWIVKEVILSLFKELPKEIWTLLLMGAILSISVNFLNRINFKEGEHHHRGENFKFPKISFGFIVGLAILVITYFYSQSPHFFAYGMIYGIPTWGLWIIAIILALIAWKWIDYR